MWRRERVFSAQGAFIIEKLKEIDAGEAGPAFQGKHPRGRLVINEPVFKTWDYLAFGLLSILNLGIVGYSLFYWFVVRGPSPHPVLFMLLSVPVVVSICAYEARWLTLPTMRRPRPMPASPGLKVGVATTFVPGAEPIQMLEDTLRALVAMDYPHETWVLDEGDDQQVKAMCERLGVRHFSRKGMPHYQTAGGRFGARTKHGNYNAWLEEEGFSRYDIIVAFDPDHIPHRRFLKEVLGYFDDPSVGYVQAPQVYYNKSASFVARGAAEETYAYYSSIQMTTYALGYPIVTGCHNSHRSSALKEVGGFAPHDADDLLITIFYRAKGWKGVYVPRILALGLVPVDWPGYIRQQRRWARSVLDVKFRIFPRLAGDLPATERVVSFLHGLYYLHGLGAALTVGVLCYMLISGAAPRVVSFSTVPRLLLLTVVLQACDFYRQRFFLDIKEEFGFNWRAMIVRYAKWPYILLALKDALLPREKGYEVTLKVKPRTRRFVVAPAQLLVAGVVGISWALGAALGTHENLLLHAAAGAVVTGSVALSATELLPFPQPFDARLSRQARSLLAEAPAATTIGWSKPGREEQSSTPADFGTSRRSP